MDEDEDDDDRCALYVPCNEVNNADDPKSPKLACIDSYCMLYCDNQGTMNAAAGIL